MRVVRHAINLQELYEEYFAALRRPGTPLKTFRVKVYVFPALQFETMYAAPESGHVDARYECPWLYCLQAVLCD